MVWNEWCGFLEFALTQHWAIVNFEGFSENCESDTKKGAISLMSSRFSVVSKFLVTFATVSLVFCAAAAQDASSPLTLRDDDGHAIHILPTVHLAPALAPDSGPLVYNGGPVIQASLTTYAIFWVPAKLQNGGATSMTAHYQLVLSNMLRDYEGHGLDNNNTQYYQVTKAGAKQYIQNKGAFGASYVDTDPYPASGCSDSATPGNCITDAQLQTELKKVMALEGWTGGLTKMFLVFTSSNEGSCFDSSSTSCAYTDYCAYHSYIAGTTPIVYSNEPFGAPEECQAANTPSPNADVDADTAATAAAHEVTEAITDPEINAWLTAGGSEIGDLCAYKYGTNTWDSSKANQMWNGRFYEIQMMYSNHAAGCVRVGP